MTITEILEQAKTLSPQERVADAFRRVRRLYIETVPLIYSVLMG